MRFAILQDYYQELVLYNMSYKDTYFLEVCMTDTTDTEGHDS
jgi:hypothetical protein